MKPFKLGRIDHVSGGLAARDLISVVKELMAACNDLDERIARFETGAAYERNEHKKNGWAISSSTLKRLDKLQVFVDSLGISRYDKTRILTEFYELLADIHKSEASE